MGTLESDAGGISRRDLITKAVAAGGLAWTAPVLLSGPAAAQSQVPCCPEGTPITVKIPEGQSPNCGNPEGCELLIFDCADDLANCLGELNLVIGSYDHAARTGHIELAAGVNLISGSVKSANCCFRLNCEPGLTSSETDAVNPNQAVRNSNFTQACQSQHVNPPLPPAPGGVNRIWVTPNPNTGGTTIFIDMQGQPLNPAEISICVSPEITALCP